MYKYFHAHLASIFLAVGEFSKPLFDTQFVSICSLWIFSNTLIVFEILAFIIFRKNFNVNIWYPVCSNLFWKNYSKIFLRFHFRHNWISSSVELEKKFWRSGVNQKMDILLNQTEEMETITIHFQKCSGLDPSVCSSVCPIQNKFSSSRYLQTGDV